MSATELAAAIRSKEASSTGNDLPPFHGVPFTVKSSIDVAGRATSQGLRTLADAYPVADAPAVERLKAAGGIPVGRTNLPKLTVRWHAEGQLYGPVMNPVGRIPNGWHVERRRGGGDRHRHVAHRPSAATAWDRCATRRSVAASVP